MTKYDFSDLPTLEIFGGDYRRARKTHICWLCGKEIPANTKYFTTNGKVGGKMFSVKHHRETCEIVPEHLDQNVKLRPSVFESKARLHD